MELSGKGNGTLAMRVWRFLLRALILAAMAACLPGDAFSLSINPPPTQWMKLFDGKDLSGWGYASDYWRVDSGMIHGEGKSPDNIFAHVNRKFSDFVLTAKSRLWQTPAGYTNSGIQYRSEFIDSASHRMKGYQSDIGDSLDGAMYPEGGYPAGVNMQYITDACKKSIHANGWNQVVITANGTKVTHELNGNKCLEYTATVLNGYIGLQLHSTDLVMKVDFRDIYIRPLNNSFTIPDSLAVTLDDTYSPMESAILARPRSPSPGRYHRMEGDRLVLASQLWGGDAVSLRVTLSDMQGKVEFAGAYPAGGPAPVELVLPPLGDGLHVLRVLPLPTAAAAAPAGKAFSDVVRLDR